MKSLKINLLSLLIVMIVIPFYSHAQSQVPDGVYPNTVDTLGRKQGAWKKLDENGTCIYVGQFKDDKPYGVFKYFDTDGRIMTEMNFVKGETLAYATMYGVSGKIQAEGKYVNQQKDSLWKFYTEDGVLLSEENYNMGKKEGKSVTYFPGTKQLASETTFVNGMENGPYYEYYEDGAKKEIANYNSGNLEGTATWYFPDGKINIVGAYQHAVKNGVWMYYGLDENGKYIVKGKETWKNGKLISGETVIKPADMKPDPNLQNDGSNGKDPNGGQ
ncbi:MAG: toxin-antitoxin system YwqK family antitoxin [Bacteroidetes bacterium]|nr:toxin-antitoxin system YwqK family antitoxin [Bacteroidota bacterium]